MHQFPLAAEVDALVSSEDTMLVQVHAVSMCAGDSSGLQQPGGFNVATRSRLTSPT